MTVYRNEGRYDTSNVVFHDGEIAVYDKKNRLPEMRHIDYGLSLFKASVFESYSADQPFDLAEVMGKLVREKQLAGYEVRRTFLRNGFTCGLGGTRIAATIKITMSFAKQFLDEVQQVTAQLERGRD